MLEQVGISLRDVQTNKSLEREKLVQETSFEKGSQGLSNAPALQSSNLQKNEPSLSSSNMASNMSCSMIRISSYLGFNRSLAMLQSFKSLMREQKQVFFKAFYLNLVYI